MTAQDLLDSTGSKQGWDERTKFVLACRFIDNLELMLTTTGGDDPLAVFAVWLDNQAEWENDHGLNPGRAS